MAQEELAKALDYILNRSTARDIDVLSAAVVRRKRDIAMFGNMPMVPDAAAMAKEITSQFNLEGNIESMKNSVRDYAIRMVKQLAPELTDAQINELTGSWIGDGGTKADVGKSGIPRDVLISMIDSFVSFSLGRMSEEDDQALRREMGPWPDKYWKSFPDVIRLLLTDYIKGEITENDFHSRLSLALKN